MRVAIGWVLTALLSLAFLFFGGTKIVASDMHAANFVAWGYPSWFTYVVGVFEIAAAALVWHPRTMFYGVKLVGILMMGAAITHAIHAEYAQIGLNVALIACGAAVAFLRRDDWPAWVDAAWLRFFGKKA